MNVFKHIRLELVYWPAWEMHDNNLRLVLGLRLVRVSSRVRVMIRVKVRVSVITSHHIETTDAGLDGLCIREINVYHMNL